MKKSGLLLFVLITNIMFSQNIREYRKLLQTGEDSERDAKALIQKSTEAYQDTKLPIYKGFLAVGHFFMAKHSFNPLKKMSYFNEGKKIMESALREDPQNLEVRLMRLITQENAPRILGYNRNIRDDRAYLTREYSKADDKDLKVYIKEYLKL